MSPKANETPETNTPEYDVVIVGAGSSGLPAAIFSSQRGARVLLIDKADKIGGSLWVATGQMSAAGTKLQQEKGIDDSADKHFDDVMNISHGTANPEIVRLAVDNAAATFDWLMEQGLVPLPDHPVKGFGHEPYSLPRYYWAADGATAVLDVLSSVVDKAVAEHGLEIRLQTALTGLVQDDSGAVTGVTVTDADGHEQRISARNVVLTTGGYNANMDMYYELNGFPQYCSLPYPHNKGDGLVLGQEAGGYLRGQDKVFINFGMLFNTTNFPAKPEVRLEHFPERRQPWEIYVNVRGERFLREDITSVDARERALMLQPDYRYWVVFDEAILNKAPPITIGWSRDELKSAFAKGGPAFLKADTIEDLAAKAGISPEGLKKSIEGYNYGVETGNDFFGRTHLPAEIGTAPYYALRMQGCAISSAVGLAVDGQLRVTRPDGRPIDNLYAAGEMLGSSQTMGKAACGGMMVTPAMTFGRLLGQKILPL